MLSAWCKTDALFLTKQVKKVKESLLYKLRFKLSLKNYEGFDIFFEHGESKYL